MMFSRRALVRLAGRAIALPAVSRGALAQSYPARPVRIVVAFPPANATDIITRLVAQGLSERIGQSFITENRPGAGGNIGTGYVVKAPADGYTLLMALVTTSAINETLYPNLDFDFARDLAPVASIGSSAYILAVHPSVPANSVPELITYAKANAGKVNMASSGTGSPSHIFGELFKIATGIELLHIPYRGGFLPDLIAGQVQVVFAPVAQIIELIRTGKLRALAVTSKTRQAILPDLPPIADFVPDYDATARYGIVAPKATPPAIIERLNREIGAVLTDPAVTARLADLGVVPVTMTPAELATLIAVETEKWRKVVQFAGLKAE
jgi:tripartite-type tricarboxylate transporter receptor subunit TctC